MRFKKWQNDILDGIDAVIFDLDGLLVDTENMGIDILDKVIRRYSIKISAQDRDRFVGCRDADYYDWICTKRKIKYSAQLLFSKHTELYNKKIQKSVPLLPYAQDAVRHFGDIYKSGLVSGSLSRQIRTILQQIGLSRAFDVIVSAEDVKFGKPSPEGFLLAAKMLRTLPSRCLVFEDSTHGIKAAKDAHMKCIAVTVGSCGRQNLSQADVVIKNFGEILDFYSDRK